MIYVFDDGLWRLSGSDILLVTSQASTWFICAFPGAFVLVFSEFVITAKRYEQFNDNDRI